MKKKKKNTDRSYFWEKRKEARENIEKESTSNIEAFIDKFKNKKIK